MELSSKFIENFNMWCSKCRDITTPDINLLLRSGGKLIEMNKKGKKIYIKKKNRGKFTSYCGGKVTSECIARGKRSSSPTIRKRATFAANARKWKHLNGGNIKRINTLLKLYPEVSLNEEPWAEEYFHNNPNVAGMAIGEGLNGVYGSRRVIVNPYNKLMKDPIQREGLLTNERLRHYMDESNFILPNISDSQLNKYKGTSYENDTINIGRTEAARYLVNDKSNSLTKEQVNYVNSLFNKKLGGIINGVKFVNKTHNAPSILDTNLNMANRSLKILKRKKFK